ncbi:gallate dioxygenase [Sphingomonas canadensis]|uniref:Gallate dioxygenase n=1 Tax=Sphingomonas canadensis TaxID=1219257 RepID=A0ABW3H3K9_9SPHN|nr:gallate dioxygenase [Sphingomonas canadensis]MCW3835639.1 gallate dioxygenase [Sphingomonas canadensis]
MATIVGGIATSHTPTIGFALDAKKQDDPVWKPIFEGYEPVKAWLAEKQPDVLFYIYNDHMTAFFADHYSHFALGIGAEYGPADEGGGPRDLPPIQGDPKFAQHIATALVAEEFDLSYFQGKNLDHGAFSPLSVLLPHENGWPVRMIPLQCGVLQFPIPSAKRFWKFGKALRRAIQSYPEDIKVAIVGTGGLSHQVHGERCGFNNTPWDMEFMERLTNDPESLIDTPIARLAELGGLEGAEVVMWMLMRGALAEKVTKLHQTYYLPSMTPIACMILEDASDEKPAESDAAFAARMNRDLAGIEKLEGTYPFTIERSVKGYRINHFLHSLVEPEMRRQFQENEEECLAQADLTDEERGLIRRRDWIGMIHYGVIFFMLEKLGAVTGVGNIHIYAAMKGMSIDDFQKTRNAAVTYGVAGKQ